MTSSRRQSIRSRHARLVPGIHVFVLVDKQDVDGRDKPGHDKDEFRPNFLEAIVT
jgi:hypothetical protein